MSKPLPRPASRTVERNPQPPADGRVYDTAFVARTLDRLIAGRIQDLDTLRQIALEAGPGLDPEALHRQLVVLARSAREAYESLQQSREILVGLHRKASGGDVVAAVDGLTGLPNRAAFAARLARDVAALTPARTLSMVLIELGSLQLLAHEIGQGAASRIVKRFAVLLRRTLKRSDYIARTGHHQFAVIFEDILPEKTVSIALRIHDAIQTRKTAASGPVADMLSVTIGIAAASGPAASAELLMEQAEAAVVQARKEGRPTIYVA